LLSRLAARDHAVFKQGIQDGALANRDELIAFIAAA
jgi:hypothetical protein